MTRDFIDPSLKDRHTIKHDPADVAATVSMLVQLTPQNYFHLNRRKHLGRTMRDGSKCAVKLSWMELFIWGRFVLITDGREVNPLPKGLPRLLKTALEERKRLAVSR